MDDPPPTDPEVWGNDGELESVQVDQRGLIDKVREPVVTVVWQQLDLWGRS